MVVPYCLSRELTDGAADPSAAMADVQRRLPGVRRGGRWFAACAARAAAEAASAADALGP